MKSLAESLSLAPMFDPTNSSLRHISEGFLKKAGRLTVRVLIALGLIAAITFISFREIRLNAITVGFFYLVAILVIATVWGLWESTTASVTAMLCFNYFFLPPIGQFTIADPQNWVALFAFLATSLTASQLSIRLKRQKAEAVNRQQEMERLYALSRDILLTDAAQPTARQITHQIARVFEFPSVALYDRNAGEIYRSGPEPLPDIDAKLHESALRSMLLNEDGGRTVVVPIRLGGQPSGSLAVKDALLSDAALQSLLNLVAVGLEKARAQEAVNRAEVTQQSEQLKSTLLDAIAHEFKTPLTSIKAITTDLLSNPDENLSLHQREAVVIADDEADRLDRLVSEAIQLARIEGGKFQLNPEAHLPGSLVSAALRQMESLADGRALEVLAGDDLPVVRVDADLIRMVIAHLIDNALKYSPPNKPISVGTRAGDSSVIISVADQGPGIPEGEQSRIFEKFYRGTTAPHLKGTGMGLAIAREIVHAHGGEIWVRSNPGEGSEFCFSLPVGSKE